MCRNVRKKAARLDMRGTFTHISPRVNNVIASENGGAAQLRNRIVDDAKRLGAEHDDGAAVHTARDGRGGGGRVHLQCGRGRSIRAAARVSEAAAAAASPRESSQVRIYQRRKRLEVNTEERKEKHPNQDFSSSSCSQRFFLNDVDFESECK